MSNNRQRRVPLSKHIESSSRMQAHTVGKMIERGVSGWSPITANVSTEDGRQVMQVVDWTGGSGEKPAVGAYVGPTGFVTDVNEASNIRGGTSRSLMAFTSRSFPQDGVQKPDFYMPRDGKLAFVEVSSDPRPAEVVVDIAINEVSVFGEVLPAIPSEGGKSARITPVNGEFKQGDLLQVHLSNCDGSAPKIVVYIGFD